MSKFCISRCFAALMLILALFVSLPPGRAQSPALPSPSAEDPAEFGEAAEPITAMRGMGEKNLIFIFDVSGSMNHEGNLRRAREAAIHILRESARPHDHIVLFTFGAGYKKVLDTTLESRQDLSALIQQVPHAVEDGAGTNIRKPHHEGLKIAEVALPRPSVVVLLTDSFNDEPKSADAEYPTYLKYYTPGGLLTRYPNTPENQDYERLLRKLTASGKLTQFGIGIKIGDDGRPIERLPQAAPSPVTVPDTPPQENTRFQKKPEASPLPYVLLGGGAALLVILYFALRPLTATTSVRISGGPAGKKDFAVKNGQTVRLGGQGASVAFDAYSLPAAKEPVAVVKGARGQLTVSPLSSPGNGNPGTGTRVYHNGLVLERESPLNYGDELRISVPEGDGAGPVKEYRLKFEDPRSSF